MRPELQEALDKVTIPMLNDLQYGEELKLNDKYTLYRYHDDDSMGFQCVSIVETKYWLEVLAVLWDDFNIQYDVLNYEAVYHE